MSETVDTNDFRRRIERLTVAFGDDQGGGREHVIVSWHGKLADGFALARQRLDEGHRVRLVAYGATIEVGWPAWVLDSNLLLTELGAYRKPEATSVRSTQAMRTALRAWLRRGFADVCLGDDDVFFASAASRLFGVTGEFRAIVDALHEHHANDSVEFIPRSTIPARLYEAVHGRREASRRDYARWAAVVGAYWFAGLALAFGQQARDIVTSADSLARVRKAMPPAAQGEWVALIPDLTRVNRHVLDVFGRPAHERGVLAGVLFVASFRTGERSEADLKSNSTAGLWPGLGSLREARDRIPIYQAVGPDTLTKWATALPGDALAAARVLVRVVAMGPRIAEGDSAHPLTDVASDVGKLASVDVVRARAANRAARQLPLTQLRSARVAFVGCQSPAIAAVNAVLQEAGATTIEALHGVYWGEIPPASESPASLVVTWTEPDAAAFREIGRDALQAGMPARARSRAQRAPRNVLLLTSYAHRDDAPYCYPFLSFEHEILVVPDLVATNHPELAFRWRPHPADTPALVTATSTQRPDLELSFGARTLADDLDWADVVVSTVSSSVCEALLTDVPVFVHAPPHLDGAARFIAPERRFFRAREVRIPFARVLAQLASGDPATLEPERAARTQLFGKDLSPRRWDGRSFSARPRPVTL